MWTDLADGLYRVSYGSICAGFVVEENMVMQYAPVLRAKMRFWVTKAEKVQKIVDISSGVNHNDAMINEGEMPHHKHKKGNQMAKVKVQEKVEEVTTLSAKEAAIQLGTNGRELRKFLRHKHGLVGQGKRWAINPSDIEEMRAEFEDYTKPKKEVKVIVADEVDEDDLEVLELDDDDIETLELDDEDDDEDENDEVDELTVD